MFNILDLFFSGACHCPVTSMCQWEGNLDQLKEHLGNDCQFKVPILEGDDIIFMLTDLHLPGEVDWITDWVMMQNCFGHQFL